MLMQYKVVPKILMDMNIKLKNTTTHYTSNQSWLEDFFSCWKNISLENIYSLLFWLQKFDRHLEPPQNADALKLHYQKQSSESLMHNSWRPSARSFYRDEPRRNDSAEIIIFSIDLFVHSFKNHNWVLRWV